MIEKRTVTGLAIAAALSISAEFCEGAQNRITLVQGLKDKVTIESHGQELAVFCESKDSVRTPVHPYGPEGGVAIKGGWGTSCRKEESVIISLAEGKGAETVVLSDTSKSVECEAPADAKGCRSVGRVGFDREKGIAVCQAGQDVVVSDGRVSTWDPKCGRRPVLML